MWDDLEPIFSIAASIATVLSLIFVVYELRGIARGQRAANRQSIAERTETLLIAQAESVEYLEAHLKANANQPLSDIERLRYTFYLAAALRLAEEAFLQHKEGTLDAEYWQSRSANLAYRLRTDAAKTCCRDLIDKRIFTASFTEWMSQRLSQCPPPPSPIASR